MMNEIKNAAAHAAAELIEKAGLKAGDVLVVGCSSSEMLGEKIGSFSSTDAADACFEGIYSQLREKGIFLAAQCCEHLNRAIITEKEVAEKLRLPIVNVVPRPKAGGSFATAAYREFKEPVALENIQADAGIDIGGTLIGMHLKPVAVPVRLETKAIGKAGIICARTRPKFIGGVRAHYDEEMM